MREYKIGENIDSIKRQSSIVKQICSVPGLNSCNQMNTLFDSKEEANFTTIANELIPNQVLK